MAANTGASERTVGQLVADASSDLSHIIKDEIDLAKIEVKSDVQKAGKGGAMLAAAGVVALFMLGFLLTAAAWGLYAAGLSRWLSFLIVAIVLMIVAAVLGLMGKKELSKLQGGPKKALASNKKTIEALKPSKG